ncbi:MAG: TonB-dependent receptor, partial [Acidobacteria bacterium]|nr:TonB-dependent receptor [Acidobacteriota bacterium]
MDRPRSEKALLVCWVFLACPLLVHAQVGNQGSLEGGITDPVGAVLPGAVVKVRNLQTSATFQTTTSKEGFFRFAVLPVGTYELAVEHTGFAPLTVKEVVVTVGAKVHLPLTLRVATHSESVVVEDDPPLLETTRTAVSATVDNRAISELPVHGREFISFVLLTPGVTNDIRGGLSFAGQRAMNSLLVDGVDENDSFWDQPLGGEGFSDPNAGTSQYHFSQDAVQEFQVNSSSYSVEFGRASGGVTNAVTKSGTNEFHGSAYWFYRDRALNATDFVNNLNGQPKDPFHFNQFGGTVGGPVRRNKLFFFFNYEGLRSKRANAVFLNLPTGFQLSSDPVVAGFQQQALDYLMPRAVSWILPIRQDVYLTKFDWQIAPGHWLTGRWVRQRLDTASSSGAQASFENSVPGFLDNDVLSASLTSTLSPLMINAFRFAFIHAEGGFVPGSANPLANIFEGGQLVLAIGRANGTPQRNRLNRVQLSDTLSYIKGRHTLKAGVDFLLDSNSYLNAQNFVGNYRFLSLESFGRSLAGVPVPLPGEQYLQAFSGEGTSGAEVHPNVHDFTGFVEDEWRLQPNLTLTLGLRYDLQVSAKPLVKNPSPALAAAGIDTSALPTDKNNFAPRVGLAWSPLNSQRLVVRAGYGIF